MSTPIGILFAMRAVIYVRQSLDKSGEGAAVRRQLSECQDLVKRSGWDLVDIYRDNDKSATRGTREGWERLLADLEQGRFDTLVCWHTDRLYRRLRDLVDLVELAETHSLRIVAVRAGDVDLTTPAGRMLAGMLGSAARFEVEQKAIRQVTANMQRAKAGTVLWTRRPFGFDRDGKDVYVVPDEAREIKRATKAVLDGATLASVARDLDSRGVRTSLGGTWTVKTIKQVLRNPRIAGRVVYRGQDMGKGSWEPILDAETYDRLQAVLTDPRRRTSHSGPELKYLLSGEIRCSRCQVSCYASMAYLHSTGEPYGIYLCRSCKRTRKREYVDALVEGVVVERLSRPDAVGLLAEDVDVAGLRSLADELRRRRDGLATLLSDGLLSEDAVREQAGKINAKITDIERQVDSATGDGPLTELVEADDVEAAWGSLSMRKRREVVRSLMTVSMLPAGKGSRFDPSSIQIEWKGRA